MIANRFMSKRLMPLLFAILLPLLANAEIVEIDGIWYNLVSKAKQAEVTESKGTEYSGVVTIPATVTYNNIEYCITTIRENAFYWCSDLTSITIPEGITSIGNDAFFGCSGLLAVHISNIESWCKITFGDFNSNPIAEAHILYLNGELVTELTIPQGVTSIKKDAFSGCDCLTSMGIPESVNLIEEGAFSDCKNLTSINFPKGRLSIKGGAFRNCRSLTSITFLGETSIDANVFSGCSSLASVILPKGITSISDRVFYDCSNLTSIIIPEGVTKIGNYAFYGCSSLASISIPQSITSIGYYAFTDCISLTDIVLPKNISYINSKAFANCTGLTDVYCYAESIPSTKTDAFDGSYIENAKLHAPTSAITNYKSTTPWSSFGMFETLDIAVTCITLNCTSVTLVEGDVLSLTTMILPDNAEDKSVTWSSSNPNIATVDNTGTITAVTPGIAIITVTANDGSGVSASCEVIVNELILGKCATPTISYAEGGVSLTCATEGSKVITIVSDNNDNIFDALEFDYIPTHTLTAYATKEKYKDSDAVSLTICWIECPENHKNDNRILTIPSKPVLIQSQGGTITLSGLADDAEVAAYDLAGRELATGIASNGIAELATGLEVGSTAIVKIGNNNIKIVVK